jgi:hypothetical protein
VELGEDYGRDYFPRPARPAGAPTGGAFAAKWMANKEPAGVAWAAREDAIAREITSGNVPSFIWGWKDVVARDRDPRAVYLVTPDVLAIGSDDDFVRMPMDAITAQRVADHHGCLLPTRKMVNQIFEQADAQLVAITKQYNWPAAKRTDAEPDRSIRGSVMAGYLAHHREIEVKLAGHARTQLVAGHKKEVIIGPRMEAHPDKLYFCGFHDPTRRGPNNPNGFIQMGSGPSVHHARFADYAQGVRLVNPYMTIDGEPKLVAEVLKNRTLAPLISDGVIARPGYRLGKP